VLSLRYKEVQNLKYEVREIKDLKKLQSLRCEVRKEKDLKKV